MWSVGQHLGHDYRIFTLRELGAIGSGERDRCHPDSARQLLRGLAANSLARATLRRVVGAELRVRLQDCSDEQVIGLIADLLARGRLFLRRVRLPRPDLSPARPVAATRPRADVAGRPAWIKVQVLEDAGDEPVPGVALAIRRTDGAWTRGTTGDDGLVEVAGMASGVCAARCELRGATLENTLAVAQGSNAAAGIIAGGPWRIARVEEHRVRSGETLEQLAAGASLDARELAYFNWRTRDPEEINAHLCNDVGCTRLTTDGASFVFDDSDEPGVLHIPTAWDEQRLATETTHTVRVRRVARGAITGHVWVQLVTCFDHPLARIPCTLRGGGRRWPARETSDEGEVRWDELPLDDYVLSLSLGGRGLALDVPWVREAFALHYERVVEADVLLGEPEDPHGVQVRLLGLGHDPGPIDGVVGPRTLEAIDAFRERQGLPRTGRRDAGAAAILADLFGA